MRKVCLAGAAYCLLPVASTVAANCVDFDQPLMQGGLVLASVKPSAQIKLDGEALEVLSDGTLMLAFDRDAPASSTLEVSGCRQMLSIEQRDYAIQRVEGVPQETVTPPPERLARIRRESALVRSARAQSLHRMDLLASVREGFSWPVTGPISGVYGSQRYYNGVPKRPHYGVDVARPTGTIVRAPAAGVVTLAEPDLFYSGGTIILDHGFRLSSSFLHLSKVLVKPGDELKPGDILGEIGATGRATGAHLDWRMNWRDRRIDPQLLVPPMPKP